MMLGVLGSLAGVWSVEGARVGLGRLELREISVQAVQEPGTRVAKQR